MTAQYLCGEIGTRLEQLETLTPAFPLYASSIGCGWKPRPTPPTALPAVTTRAFEVADDICWHALVAGEVNRFIEVAALAAELRDFAIFADLLDA
jgi:hypothetical protein